MSAKQTLFPFPFTVGFPLSIRQSADSISICGANRGMGHPVLCEVPKTPNAEKDAQGIIAACESCANNSLQLPGSDYGKIAALKAALGNVIAASQQDTIIANPRKLTEARALIADCAQALALANKE